jgi:hypothetical protein
MNAATTLFATMLHGAYAYEVSVQSCRWRAGEGDARDHNVHEPVEDEQLREGRVRPVVDD